MRVTELHKYPLAGAQGVGLQEAFVDQHGLIGDRTYALVATRGSDNGRLYQKKHNRLARIKAETPPGEPCVLRLSSPLDGYGSIDIEDNRFDGREMDLVVSTRSGKIVPARPLTSRQRVNGWLSGLLGEQVSLVRVTHGNAAFKDGVHLTTEATLKALDEEVAEEGGPATPMNRFRPNIVVDGDNPWEEHDWPEVEIGGRRFVHSGDTDRCVYVARDQRTGESRSDTALGIIGTRHSKNFGIMLRRPERYSEPARIRVGDMVE